MRHTSLVAAAVAALAVVSALTGCSGGGSTASGDCHLEILGRDRATDAEAQAWQKTFDAFKSEYDCTVTATWKGDFTAVAANLNASRLAGEQVDLVTTATSNYALAQSGLLMDLTKVVDPYKDRFTDKGLADFSLGDHLWSMPYGGQSYSAFFYSKPVFEKYDITPPTTYAEFVAVTKKLADAGVTPIAQGGKDTWAWPMWLMETIAQTTDNKSIATLQSVLSGDGSFTDSAWVSALAEVKQFATDGLINSDALDTDGTGALAEIAQGKAAMTYNGSWTLDSARAANVDVGVFKFPLMDPASSAISQPSGVTEDGIAIPSFINPDHLKMADQFLEFISRQQYANDIMAPQNLLVPAVKSVTPASDPLGPEILADYQPVTVEWLDWIWPNEVNDAAIQAVQSMLFTDTTPEAAAASMQDALDKLRKQSDYQYDWWNHMSDDQWKAVTPSEIPTIEVKS